MCRASLSSQAGDLATAATIQSLHDENLALRNTLQEMTLLALPSELTSDQSDQVTISPSLNDVM